MNSDVKIVFASASDDINPTLIDIVADLRPELDLYVVSEFPPHRGQWIQYHVHRTFRDNLAKVRANLRGRRIRLAALVLQPRMPFWRMRMIPVVLAPLHTLFFNENLDHFMLRPRAVPHIARHAAWRLRNLYHWETKPGGTVYTFAWRVRHPHGFRRPWLYRRALATGRWIASRKAMQSAPAPIVADQKLATGVSVIIPSRDGCELLRTLLPGLSRELKDIPSEIIVVDNGSSDGTMAYLSQAYPSVRVIASTTPLSFARAVNRGIDAAQFARTLLLNNDMELHPAFFAPLLAAFEEVRELFCATAQIFFPEGQRREETGKAFLRMRGPDFPAYCAEPITGEDSSYVLYGSGGCSMYDTGKLRALGRVGEVFEPAYVEDLDLGFRGWQRAWPTVFVAGAKVIHRHRATTSRYYSEQELERVLERNYLRFLARSVAHPEVFRSLWKQAIERLNANATNGSASAAAALEEALQARAWVEPASKPVFDERLILALGSGDVAVFRGRATRGLPVILVATPYLPYPLSHGGAVRMYNLMRRAANEFEVVLVAFCDELSAPPREVVDFCAEVVMVRRVGKHEIPSTDRPDVVEEFDSDAFRGALRQTIQKWKPGVAQLEFTQLAQYAVDCAPARTLLVEHDVTLDLYEQLLKNDGDWEIQRQLDRWRRFETQAWRDVDCVIAMSEKDRAIVEGARRTEALPNGVDLERFRPSGVQPEPRRILFIGSFAHLPNLIAVAWFIREVWPLLADLSPQLHVIAGSRHTYFLDLYRSRVDLNVNLPGVEVDDFVSDVRPAYDRASVVIAPLQASAGTNIKIMEAMAMEKAIVSTARGVNGLEVTPGIDYLLGDTAPAFAAAVRTLFGNPETRRRIERQGRRTAEEKYNWDRIADQQSRLYRDLLR